MEEITIIWEDKAKEQARDIYGYIYEGNSMYADEWADEIEKNLSRLTRFPEMGRIVPDFDISFIREVFAGLYRVVYTYQNNTITIVAVRPMLQPLGKL